MSLTQISRSSYYWNTNGIPRSTLKSMPSSFRQKGFNHDHIWTLWWSNQDQNCSRSTLCSGPPSRKTCWVPQSTTHSFFGSDDNGPSYGPYKQVVAVKLINNYTNNEPYNPHGFKEQVKIKYNGTKTIARKFPNGTVVLMELLNRAQPSVLDWAVYYALTPD